MPSLTAFAEAGFEPIPGYVLREKLGSGGFGEVWLADAPGGLKKALKLVFGSVDDSRAANELKSLQRIRQINHPFILSLERIEVINGQLIVVTELADCSLYDKFCEMRKRGLAGIPRERLLKYLGDAADALDFICQKYELQHLDVKPGNLLLVADHIKLADFGLIKDLQRTNQSMLTGLTPVYAAPEMFDGRPCRSSDQYALAIVYQEMLTGTFPFQGRTTAQLATEHLNRAPNLEPLPIEDRPTIARALSKKPSQRFASCREMIDHLIKSEPSQLPANPNSSAPVRPRARSAVQSRAAFNPQTAGKTTNPQSRNQWMQDAHNRTTAQTEFRRSQSSTDQFSAAQQSLKVNTLAPIEFSKASIPEGAAVFIGLGRTGLEALVSARSRLDRHGRLDQRKPAVWFGVDTDKNSIEWACDSTTPGALDPNDVIHLPLHIPQYYKDKPKELYSPVSRRWLYNIPRSKRTEGVRALGLLAFLDQTFQCYDLLGSSIATAIARLSSSGSHKRVNIYLVASSHGGTGSALISEFGFLSRRVMAELRTEVADLEPETITAVLTTGTNEENASHELACASSIACLRELDHYMKTRLHPGFPALPSFPLAAPPIDDVYTLNGGRLGKTGDWHQAILNASDFLCQDVYSSFGSAMREHRESLRTSDVQADREFQPWLRTYLASNIQLSGNIAPSNLAKHWLLEVLLNWYTAFDAAVRQAKELSESASEHSFHGQPMGLRKTMQAVELFCDDLFRENAWNAQAWVRTCFEFLLPHCDGGLSETVSTHANLSDLLDEKIFVELEDVQKVLHINTECCQTIAASMIDNSISAMMDFIRKHWLSHQANLTFVGLLLDRITNRLERNSQSLQIVSNRFSNRETELLTAIGRSGARTSAEDENLGKELANTRVQRSVHALASLMLQRVSNLIKSFADSWQREVLHIETQLQKLSLDLARDLDLPIDDESQIQQAFFPLPGNWKRVRGQVQVILDQTVTGFASQLLEFVFGIKNSEQQSGEGAPSNTTKRPDDLKLSDLVLLTQHNLTNNASKYHLLSQSGSIANLSSKISTETISEAIKSSSTYNFTEGSARRLVLVLPIHHESTQPSTLLPDEFQDSVSTLYSDVVDAPELVMDGEQLHLDDLIHTLWPLSSGRSELIKRLLTRIDVDWPDAG